jgi:hypothetical protein
MSVAMSGNDTITLQNYLFANLADGNCVELTFATDIASVKVGKNQNAIFALNANGNVADVKMRIIRGSADDQFLMSLMAQQQSNFAGFVLLQGTFIKKVGDGAGNITNDTYVMSGGIFAKLIQAKSNVEGDTEQSISMYEFKFANSARVIG